MERGIGDRNFDRHFTGTRVPVSENHGRHQVYQYPHHESTIQNPFLFETTDLNQTLESAFSRLDLSGGYSQQQQQQQPPFFPTSPDGDFFNGSAYDFTRGGGEGLLPQHSMLEIEQSNAELQRLAVLNNGVSSHNGYVDFEDYGHYPIVLGSGIENWGNFQSGSCPSSFFSEPFLNHNRLLLADNGERSGYWNQSHLQRGGFREKFPIQNHLNQNGLSFVSTAMNYNGVMGGGGSTSIDLNGYNSSLFDRQFKMDSLSLEDLRGRILSLATDQYGCRFLQMKFEGIRKEEIELVFMDVIDHMAELMVDQFGNYLIQKLVEVCNEDQRTQILLSVTKTKLQLVSICLNMHGTRSIQKLLEYLTTPQQISLVISALSPGVVLLTKDMNGHHVIQHCLKHFTDEDNKYLLNEVTNNCFAIATDKSGCCVLQACVENSRGEAREHLVAEILANALLLAQDRYGNYVVQHMLGLKTARVTANLLRELEGNYFSLSCNKYGSNVVEKCLMESGEEQSRQIIMELLRSPNVSTLLLDSYGNYVIQSALTVSKGLVHNALVKLIETHSQAMRSNLYGKKVLAWFDKKQLCNMYRNVQK